MLGRVVQTGGIDIAPVSQSQLIFFSGLEQTSEDPDCSDSCSSRMFSLLLFAVLCTSCLAKNGLVHYSFSRAVGGGTGTPFKTDGQGRVTAVRVWEINNAYITGIQLRYEHIWSAKVGRSVGDTHELVLFDGEVIVQISGKHHTNFIYQLIFVTSRGRSLIVGQPYQKSFNLYPTHQDSELRLLSGRYNGNGITSVAAHWGTVYMNQTNSSNVSTE